MNRLTMIALAAALAAPLAAQAQVPLGDPSTGAILTWTPAQQETGYRSIETIFKVNTIKRGAKVHPLPKARRQLKVAYDYAGKPMTTESYMAASHTSGVLVIKDGKILLERYGLGRKPTDRWTSFSVAKSLTSTLVGAAIADGKIKSLDDTVTTYIPDLAGSGYDGVTVRQLLTMTSGVRWNEDYTDPKADVARAGYEPADPGVNPLVSYMRKLPRETAPGSVFNYKTGETDLAGILVSNAVGKSLSDYLSEKIWRPYGMEQDAIWMVDAGGQERGGCCISMTLRDYGRVGQFILDGGVAGGKPVVPAGWVADATREHVPVPDTNPPYGYGYFWWIRPPGGFQAVGIFGQSITVFPEQRLVIVTNAAWPQATDRELSEQRTAFIAAVKAADLYL